MNFVLSNWIYEFIHIVNTLNSILLPRLLPNGSRQSVFFVVVFVCVPKVHRPFDLFFWPLQGCHDKYIKYVKMMYDQDDRVLFAPI